MEDCAPHDLCSLLFDFDEDFKSANCVQALEFLRISRPEMILDSQAYRYRHKAYRYLRIRPPGQ